jgi:hypothetical protein
VKEIRLKIIMLAAALLLPASMALAQDAAPAPTAPAAPKPAVRAVRPAPKPAAKPATAADRLDGLNVVQIVSVKQTDAAIYEIDAKLADGNSVNLRMNAFVMQDLARQLGLYGK